MSLLERKKMWFADLCVLKYVHSKQTERDIVYKSQEVLPLEFELDTLFTRIRASNWSITKYLVIGVG